MTASPSTPMLLDRLRASFHGGPAESASAMRTSLRRLLDDSEPVDGEVIDRIRRFLGGSSLSPQLAGRLVARLKSASASGRLASGADVHRLVREEFRALGDATGQERHSVQLMRASVERDLRDLLQMRKRLPSEVAERYPNVARSVLQQGLPDVSGTIARTWTQQAVEAMIRDVVLAFEPRIIPESLTVCVKPRGVEQTESSPSSESDERRDVGWILRAYVCEIRGVLRSSASRVEVFLEAEMGGGTTR